MGTGAGAGTIPSGTIVVGIDGSDGAGAALEWAAAQAVLERRPVTLVHGWTPVPALWLDQAGVDHAAIQDEIRAEAERVAAAAEGRLATLAPGIAIHRLVAADDPRELLLGLAARAALTVLGSRGRGRVESLLLGSVSASVARHARGPVVVVRPGAPAPGEGRGVLVAVDAMGSSQSALEAAYALASLRALPLTVLHCTWDARILTGEPVTLADHAHAHAEGRLVLAEAVAGLGEKYPDVVVRTEALHGHAPGQVVAAAEQMDLVVVGHHRRGRMGSWLLGSVAVDILERCHGAVAVVPDGR